MQFKKYQAILGMLWIIPKRLTIQKTKQKANLTTMQCTRDSVDIWWDIDTFDLGDELSIFSTYISAGSTPKSVLEWQMGCNHPFLLLCISFCNRCRWTIQFLQGEVNTSVLHDDIRQAGQPSSISAKHKLTQRVNLQKISESFQARRHRKHYLYRKIMLLFELWLSCAKYCTPALSVNLTQQYS